LPTRLASLCAALFLFVGQAASAEHNPVIFLHGWNSDGTIWSNMTNLMIKAGWEQNQLFAPSYLDTSWWKIETLGYGSSDQPITIIADAVYKHPDVQKCLHDFPDGEIDFVVHSMGGLILRQLIAKEPVIAHRVGRVVDLATPHYGQLQEAGRAAEDMKYGSPFLWNLATEWESLPDDFKRRWLSVAGVHFSDTWGHVYGQRILPEWFVTPGDLLRDGLSRLFRSRRAHHDGLVDQWSAGLAGTPVRYVDKCHADVNSGDTIYACDGGDSDPVFRLVQTFLASKGSVVLPQSECGASVPANEGGGIFLQVVNEHGDPIPWSGKMVKRIRSQDGGDVPFAERSGEDDESQSKGICMLMYPVGTFRGFDPGVYDIEFNPTANVPAFRWRGIRVEPNRPTIVQKTPQGVQMLAICLDHSTSMSENDLANAKANAKRIIDTSPAGTLIGVFAFGDNVETVFNYTEVTDANRSNLKTKIDSISRNGSTALWKAADVALNNMNTIDPNHDNIGSIILLTDGGDNASGSITRSSVVAKCQEMGVAFNSISYGDNADSNLGSASSATGGRNVHSSDSLSSLNDAFSRLITDGNCRETITDDKGTTPSSGTWTKSFVADSSIASFQATVTLVAPNGARYAANSKTDVGSESSFVFIRKNPAVGTWTVSVSAPSGTEVSCYVDAAARKEPPRLSLFVDDDDTVVYASLSYGDPVDGAAVKALIHGNGTTREVPFEPIGAGIYKLNLEDCGAFQDGFTVRADAVKGVATYTYVGVLDYEGDGEGSPIPESFTRSEWLDLSRLNAIPIRFVSVHPRWPWEGKVDIDFTAAPADSNTKVSIALVGVDASSGGRYAVSSVQCDDALADLSAGKHRITWNAAADVPDADIENFSVRFDATTAKALEDATGVTATQGTRLDGVYVSWNAVPFATHYRVYRTEANSSGAGKTFLCETSNCHYLDSGGTNVGPSLPGGELPVIPYTPISLASTMLASGDSLAPASSPALLAANSVTSGSANPHYRYWIQPIAKTSAGTIKHEGGLAMSNEGWKGTLGAVSGLSASAGTHYDGVHLSWTGPTGATQYKIYRSTSSSGSKTLLTTTTSTSFVDSNTTASQSPNRYYYWVEPIAVVSSVTYVGTLSSSVSGWRNKLGTPSFHFENWRPGHKNRPDIDLYIDGSVAGATRYEFMSGDKSAWWTKMDKVVNGKLAYGSYDGGKGSISNSASPKKATIGWAWAYRYDLKVYVRAANSEGAGDWVKWNLADHLKESAFKNSEFYKTYPKK